MILPALLDLHGAEGLQRLALPNLLREIESLHLAAQCPGAALGGGLCEGREERVPEGRHQPASGR